MEVVAPMPPEKNFHIETASSTPYVSAPSSPRAGGFDYLYHYTSAPASPTRITAIYSLNYQPDEHDHDHFPVEDNDFEFNLSGQLQKGALPPELTAADELFEAGKFKTTMKQPKSPQSHSRTSANDFRRDNQRAKSNSSRARSLSPLRNQVPSRKDNSTSSSSSSSSTSSSIVSFLRNAGNGSKKWRLKDLLLFRSASEGRVTGRGSKDPLRKYTAISPPLPTKRSSKGDDSKSSSFRSTDSGGSVRKGSVSPHELHYTTNRAASEELKKKTPLPYRQGLFGCLRFNPAVTAISRSFNNQSFS
ncbi:hypothetical protein IHE45_06G056200 [Dioscorea alata]|uniref:Uncharacterized protein n=1 Tax=Dioscorea alata TaxID=55571 RepID=A0ACB7VXI7_DIOAL|nr:hypothetical protein IHE45_06G056200 [Dioscorea alata]